MIFAVTCGISVANIYYAQPLLDAIASDFALSPAKVGLVVTLTQVGYAVGLLLVVPLGDLVDRRKLILSQTILSAVALALVGLSPTASILFVGMIAVGLLAVVVQVLVAFTASLATPSERGRAVGLVTSGVVAGILAARSVSGLIADLGGWRTVYLTSALLMILMAIILSSALPRRHMIKSSDSYAGIVKSIPALFMHDQLFRQRAIFAFLIFASFSTLWTAMVLPLSSAPYLLSHTEIGLFGLAGLAGALAANAAGRLADRGYSQWTTGVSLALLILSWLAIGLLSQSLAAFLGGVILLDFAVQAVHVTNQSLIFAARPDAHSRLVGGYMVFYSLGSAVGAIASTTIYASLGWGGVTILGGAFSAAGVLLWLFSLLRIKAK
ncbi:MFS transporter [Rhizobium sp. MJ37]|nr:MFS transporter [Rhizobium sp. MJ37]MDC9837574.1 MFS transporter [Rhizobium sp. MJ37]